MQILSDSHGAAVTSAASGPSAQKVGFPERSDIRKLYLSWSLPPCSATAELYWVFKTLDSQIQLTSQCGTAMNTDLESFYWLMFMICTFCDSQLKPQTLHEAFSRLLVKALIFSGTSHVRSTADRNREHDGKLVADILLSLPLIRCSRALWEVIPPLIPAHSHITRLGHVACLANEMGANASDALPTPQSRTFKSHWVSLFCSCTVSGLSECASKHNLLLAQRPWNEDTRDRIAAETAARAHLLSGWGQKPLLFLQVVHYTA